MEIDFYLAKSFKVHLLLAVLIGAWVVLFLILLAPFDVTDLEIRFRWLLLPFYGVLLFLSYLGSLPFQHWIYKRQKAHWYLVNELSFLALFLSLSFCLSFIYYRSDTMNGTMNLPDFFLYQFIPISVVMLPMIIFLRWAAGRLSHNSLNSKETNPKITLEGNSRKEVIRLDLQQIAYVKAADNYVEVYYLEKQELQMKLLRSTLKKINSKAPALVRAHRSYLINPAHFQQWSSPNSILIAQAEIPISKTYKAAIEKQLSFTTS